MPRAWFAIVVALLPVSGESRGQSPDLLAAVGLERPREVVVPDKQAWLGRAGIPIGEHTADGFHLVDLDGDGRTDVIYGEGGPVYLSRDAGFERVVERHPLGRFLGLVRQPVGQAPLLVTEDYQFLDWDCDPASWMIRSFRLLRSPNAVEYRPSGGMVRFQGTDWPQTLLTAPLLVRATQAEYNLRVTPGANDSTRSWSGGTWCGAKAHRGNVIASFARGTVAIAIAQRQVGERTWYFVVTSPGSRLTNSTFCDLSDVGTEDCPGAVAPAILGWMSSRGLEVVHGVPHPSVWQFAAPPRPGP